MPPQANECCLPYILQTGNNPHSPEPGLSHSPIYFFLNICQLNIHLISFINLLLYFHSGYRNPISSPTPSRDFVNFIHFQGCSSQRERRGGLKVLSSFIITPKVAQVDVVYNHVQAYLGMCHSNIICNHLYILTLNMTHPVPTCLLSIRG